MTDIGLQLERLGLEQYHDAFVAEGFDTWETLLDIQESDLDQLGVKLGHRRKLQRAIAEFRGIASDRPLGSPSQESAAEGSRPSDAFQQGTGSRENVPTTTAPEQKRKYRRHPKPDENAPEKPPSAYVLFSNKVREEVKGESLSFTEIARLVGDRWQKLDPNLKEPFETQAASLKETYNTQLAEYKKTDEYKEYSQYLADFKAKHGQAGESKRPKLELHSTSSLSGSGEGEAALQVSTHHRGGSIGSVSGMSQGGMSGTATTPSAMSMPSLPNINPPPGRYSASSARTGSPAAFPTHDRRVPGYLSSHSSVSEESGLNRTDQLDPLSRAANLSLSTPPAITPPLPSSASTGARSDLTGTHDGSAWSLRQLPYTPTAPSFASNLGTSNVSEPWRDRSGEVQRPILQHNPTQIHYQPSSVPISRLLGSDRAPEPGQHHTQRILPPLSQHLSLSAIPPTGVSPVTGPGHNSPPTTSERIPQGMGQNRSPFNRSESEAANTLAGLARRPADQDSNQTLDRRQ